MRWLEILEKMWFEWTDGLEQLPKELVDRVRRANMFVGYCGGSIASRQTVAVIVEQYVRDTWEPNRN